MAEPPAGVTIRPAGAGDREALETFMARLQDFERAGGATLRPGPEMAAAHMGALLDWAAAHPAGGCLVAEDAAGPVGFLLWGIETAFGDYVLPEDRVFAALSDLWVEPRARGRGVARALIAAAEAHVAAHGMARVEIAALPGNAAALALYERLGYRPFQVVLARRVGG